MKEQRRNACTFEIINAAAWVAIAMVFHVFPRFGIQNLIVPAAVLIIGLHFFPMPPLYHHRSNVVVGGSMVVWAILCPLVFQGDRMIGWAAAGAGLALWSGAAWALKTAHQRLRSF